MRDTIIAGDTLDFDVAVADAEGTAYLPSDGWAMTLRIIPRTAGGSVYTITAIAAGDQFNLGASAAATASWAAGNYSAIALVTKAGERRTVYLGDVVIQADPGTSTSYDARSEAQKALDSALTLYYDFVSKRVHVLEYEVAGRRMRFTSADQLVKHIEELKRTVAAEALTAKVAAGEGGGMKILTRFTT